MAQHSPLDHVVDHADWHIFDRLFGGWHVPLEGLAFDLPFYGRFQVTKFMLLEVVAAVLILVIFIPLCRRYRSGEPPRGPWANAFEGLLTFIRDEVAKPNLGEHDADAYVPFLWTMFVFILFCNLLGMVPLMGSPTSSIWMTGALGLIAFCMLHGAAIAKMGFVPYLQSMWPHIELGHGIAYSIGGFVISLLIFLIELFGSVIKSGVLAIRLFANMFAGHTVLAMILLLIVVAGENGITWSWPLVTVGSVLGVVALSLLELFVAFLQAYVFVFLTSLFMGMALHPSH
jgi:F-type H+-transporting ATPase subunit a